MTKRGGIFTNSCGEMNYSGEKFTIFACTENRFTKFNSKKIDTFIKKN